jgi:L-arabinose isomerase
MHHFHFRPQRGMEAFMDAWLQLGGPHHFVLNLGDHATRWHRLAELLELDYTEI